MRSRFAIHLAALSVTLSVSLSACTTATPNFCEDNSQCTNSAAPFCDVNGEFGDGMASTCIPTPLDATPSLVTITLNLAGAGIGNVTSSDGALDCSAASCVVEVTPGTSFTLAAVPISGNSFVTWSGPCSDFSDCTFEANETQTVTATFEPEGAVIWTATSILSAPVGSANSRIYPADIATDSQDNVIVVGQLVGTPDFGGGQLISGDASKGSSEVFAVKYTADGAHIWSHAYSGTGFSDDAADSVGITSSDEVVLVGSFEESLTFGGPGDSLDGSVSDMFMARLLPDGTHDVSLGIKGHGNATLVIDANDEMMVSVEVARFDWFEAVAASVRSLLPTPPSGTVNSSAIDGFARVVVVGGISDRVDFAPGVTGGEVGTAATTQSFVAKLNWDGSFHSSRAIAVETISCVVADPASDGSYYVVGALSQQVDLQGAGSGVIVPTGTRNGFVAKFSNSHSYLWSVHLPSSEISVATACALDPRGNLMVGGSFSTDVRLTPASPLHPGTGTFVAKYAAATGELVWGSFGVGSGTVKAIASDSVGRTTALIQYLSSTFAIGGEVFPDAGVPNLVIVQHAP